MSRVRRCKQCKRAIRGRAVHLYDTPKGPEFLCGGRRYRRCLAAYNDADVEACDCGSHPPEERERRPPLFRPRRRQWRQRRGGKRVPGREVRPDPAEVCA